MTYTVVIGEQRSVKNNLFNRIIGRKFKYKHYTERLVDAESMGNAESKVERFLEYIRRMDSKLPSSTKLVYLIKEPINDKEISCLN